MTKTLAIDEVIATYQRDIAGLERALADQQKRLNSGDLLPRYCDPEHIEYYRCLQDFANCHDQRSSLVGGQRGTSARLLYGALVLDCAKWADSPISQAWSLRSRGGQVKWRALLAAAHSGLVSACLAPHMVDAFHNRVSAYRKDTAARGAVKMLVDRDPLIQAMLKGPAVLPVTHSSAPVLSELGAAVYAAGMLSAPARTLIADEAPVRVDAYPFLSGLWPGYLKMMLDGTCATGSTPPLWLQLKSGAPAAYMRTARILEAGLTPWIPVGAHIPDAVLRILPRRAHVPACTAGNPHWQPSHHSAP